MTVISKGKDVNVTARHLSRGHMEYADVQTVSFLGGPCEAIGRKEWTISYAICPFMLNLLFASLQHSQSVCLRAVGCVESIP